jgi:acyl-homoserine lactone acylase PvdQ
LLEHPDESATGETLFDNTEMAGTQTRGEILLMSLSAALDWAQSADGFDTTDMDQWNWGKIHKTQWNDFFASFDEVYATDIKGPYPMDGASYTVDVSGSKEFFINGDDNPDYKFISYSGATIRFAAEATPDGIVAKNVIPGGQSGRIESPYYNDMAELYLKNQTHDVRFTVDDVVENAIGRFVFTP